MRWSFLGILTAVVPVPFITFILYICASRFVSVFIIFMFMYLTDVLFSLHDMFCSVEGTH
jgi:hypothetical protein